MSLNQTVWLVTSGWGRENDVLFYSVYCIEQVSHPVINELLSRFIFLPELSS
jgi:hypothetical protein